VEIRPIASRVVYANRWMTIREDAVERANGSRGIFGVVDKPDFALVIPSTPTGFWLVEQYRYPVRERLWEFPQGSWEGTGDVDPAALAAGELEEETGLRAGTMRHLGHLYGAYGYSTQGFHVFVATDLAEGPTRRSVEEADLQAAEVTTVEFTAMIQAGKIKDASTVAAYSLFLLDRATSQ
jgi:8-oxo-dGTP pyrophosphatase MutT (NUDIX family)